MMKLAEMNSRGLNKLTELESLDLKSFKTKDLKKILAQGLEITARHLSFLAKIWSELEGRGEDLTELKTGLTRYLPLVSSGRLEPEALIKFAGQNLLLKEVSLLPTSDQKRLTSGEKVAFVTKDRNENFVTDFVDVSSLHARHYNQLFNFGQIRSEDEQKKILSKQPQVQKKPAGKVRKKRVLFDASLNAIKCMNLEIRL